MLDLKTSTDGTDIRPLMRQVLDEIAQNPEAAEKHLAADCVWDIAHPVNQLVGPKEVAEKFLAPMKAALTGMERRDILFLGGTSRILEEGRWVAGITHYVGIFDEPLFGLKPSGSMVFFRSGEFYRLDDDGKIVEIWNHRHDIDTSMTLRFVIKGFVYGVLVMLIVLLLLRSRWKKKLKIISAASVSST